MSWFRAGAFRTDLPCLVPVAEVNASEMLSAQAPYDVYRFTGGEPSRKTVRRLRIGWEAVLHS